MHKMHEIMSSKYIFKQSTCATQCQRQYVHLDSAQIILGWATSGTAGTGDTIEPWQESGKCHGIAQSNYEKGNAKSAKDHVFLNQLHMEQLIRSLLISEEG